MLIGTPKQVQDGTARRVTTAELREYFPWASEDFFASNDLEERVSASVPQNNMQKMHNDQCHTDQGPVAGKAKGRKAKAVKDTAPAETEAAFQAKVLQYAKLRHWRVAHFRPAKTDKGWRTAVSADGAGFPDLILARGACLFAAELKSEKGKVSEAQAAWLAAFLAAGIPAFVWRPSDFDQIERTLE